MDTDALKKMFSDSNIPFDEPSFARLTAHSIISSHRVVHCDGDLQPAVLQLKRESSTEGDSISAIRKAYAQVLLQVPKSHKVITQNYANKVNIAKKISTLCLREFKRGMLKTGRTNILLRGRKVGKEVIFALKKTDRCEDIKKKKEVVERKKEEVERRKKEFEEMETERQARKLDFLINQTELYSHFVLNKRKNLIDSDAMHPKDHGDTKRAKVDDTHKTVLDGTDVDMSYGKARERALDAARKHFEHTMQYDTPGSTAPMRVQQPALLKAQLKEYQLKGLNWLVNLYNQGINGILADDMGLGKTIQSISFLAYLFEVKKLKGPFLIVTPTSTLPNWANELERFAPGLSVVKYYGNVKERKKLKLSGGNIILTSYSIFILDEKYFLKQKWHYMILDEAQAIKSNKSLRWSKLLKIKTRNRLLLTGTPIQNNLKELWSLLHFIMPTLFDNLVEFEEWFMKMNEDKLDRLHLILKPFMLRREKKDVASELREKKIMIIYCNLSYRQRVLYEFLEKKCPIDFKDEEIANVLMHYRKVCNHPDLFHKSEVETGFSFHLRDGGGRNVGFRSAIEIKMPACVWGADPGTPLVTHTIERSAASFDFGARAQQSGESVASIEAAEFRAGCVVLDELERNATFGVPILCYKKVIDGAPRIITEYNGNTQFPRHTLENNLEVVKLPCASNLVKDSGKLETIDILLKKLQRENHRPLIYFQMTKMIDLMEEYLKTKKYNYLRLDGSTKISERRELVERWQNEDIFIFLLSTRAGGLGINLTAADTVIFYDNDWNPTIDKQAMDRAHRLGQVRDVTVYKLVCLGTIEEKIIELAEKKDEIQKMVIEKGDFVGADI